MLCDNCNQNEANVKITQILNGKKTEMMLCEECSKKVGLSNMNIEIPIDISSFLGDLISDYDEPTFTTINSINNQMRCSHCNMTYEEFLNTQTRFKMLKAVNKDNAEELLNKNKEEAIKRFEYYKSLIKK